VNVHFCERKNLESLVFSAHLQKIQPFDVILSHCKEQLIKLMSYEGIVTINHNLRLTNYEKRFIWENYNEDNKHSTLEDALRYL
jgi:hypothetical protein